MFQFIAIMIIMGSIIAYDRHEVAKQKRWLEARYDEARLKGDKEGANFYLERLTKTK